MRSYASIKKPNFSKNSFGLSQVNVFFQMSKQNLLKYLKYREKCDIPLMSNKYHITSYDYVTNYNPF